MVYMVIDFFIFDYVNFKIMFFNMYSYLVVNVLLDYIYFSLRGLKVYIFIC